jgi:glycosyltransferase involved in cell wall biosynthesis
VTYLTAAYAPSQKKRPLRVLYYNWVDYLDDERRGGGVALYQYNLIESLVDHEELDVTFLSSGISYSLIRRQPRWQAVRSGRDGPEVPRFEIVNSGTLAPSHSSFGRIEQITHPKTAEVFFDFVRKTGPYDIVHFNNIEGLPADVLELPRRVPGTKVICSMHNYYPVCPQVNLWYGEHTSCVDFDEGRACVGCVYAVPGWGVRLLHAVAYSLKRVNSGPGSFMYTATYGALFAIGQPILRLTRRFRSYSKRIHGPDEFVLRRTRMAELINRNCTRVLCVSNRVAEILALYGIDRSILQTMYIGTKQAEKFSETRPRASIVRPDGTIRIAYLGYMRRDKGFFFLLDALEALDEAVARRIHVLVAAGRGDDHTMGRLGALHVDGYSHDTSRLPAGRCRSWGRAGAVGRQPAPGRDRDACAPYPASDQRPWRGAGAWQLSRAGLPGRRHGRLCRTPGRRSGWPGDARAVLGHGDAAGRHGRSPGGVDADLRRNSIRDADSRARTKGASDQGTDSALS